jgi:hypothetical protein
LCDRFRAIVRAILSAFCAAKSAHAIADEAYHENQAKPAAADYGTSEVKLASAKQEKQYNHK